MICLLNHKIPEAGTGHPPYNVPIFVHGSLISWIGFTRKAPRDFPVYVMRRRQGEGVKIGKPEHIQCQR